MNQNKDDYMEFVQFQAEKLGKVFMLDSGEGNDFKDPCTGWYIENLSGWLIDKDIKEKFLKDRENGVAYVTFALDYVFVIWERSNKNEICIKFKTYPKY